MIKTVSLILLLLLSESDGVSPTAGDVVITEVTIEPTISNIDAEWFEVFNLATEAINLKGTEISDDGGESHIIATIYCASACLASIFSTS